MSSSSSAERLQRAIEGEFQCHRCGNCCKGEGLVHVSAAEAGAMAEALGLLPAAFLRRYAVKVARGEWILKDKRVEIHPGTEPELWCIFLERGPDGLYGCAVHHAKPEQCRTFPARWRNPDSWRTCLGLRVLRQKLKQEDAARSDEPPAQAAS